MKLTWNQNAGVQYNICPLLFHGTFNFDFIFSTRLVIISSAATTFLCFTGECWSSQTGHLSYNRYGLSTTRCVDQCYKPCKKYNKFCSGTRWGNFVYKLSKRDLYHRKPQNSSPLSGGLWRSGLSNLRTQRLGRFKVDNYKTLKNSFFWKVKTKFKISSLFCFNNTLKDFLFFFSMIRTFRVTNLFYF